MYDVRYTIIQQCTVYGVWILLCVCSLAHAHYSNALNSNGKRHAINEAFILIILYTEYYWNFNEIEKKKNEMKWSKERKSQTTTLTHTDRRYSSESQSECEPYFCHRGKVGTTMSSLACNYFMIVLLLFKKKWKKKRMAKENMKLNVQQNRSQVEWKDCFYTI